MFRSLALGLVLTAVLGGCKSAPELDPASKARLAHVPGDSFVLLSVTCKKTPEIPPLDGGRVLGRSGSTVLLEAPRSAYPSMGSIDGLQRTVIWGQGPHAARLEPRMRTDMLDAIDKGHFAAPMAVLATFREASADMENRLRAAGAVPGTVTGRVATLEADVDAVLAILAFEDLVTLGRPKPVRMLGDGK